LVLTLVLGGCTRSETPNLPEEPAPKPLLDFDEDGLSDWFEENIAGYNPNVPNNRYIIFYYQVLDLPYETSHQSVMEREAQFFSEKGGVPPANIIELYQENATASTLKNAIDEVAKKSTENDIVFLRIEAHGGPSGISGGVSYKELDEWLNQIKAKVILVTIESCYGQCALPILENGDYPRIICATVGSDIAGSIGRDLRFFPVVDVIYGDGNGYVSLEEIKGFFEEERFLTREELEGLKEYFRNWEGDRTGLPFNPDNPEQLDLYYLPSEVKDLSNIAPEIYLVEYNPFTQKEYSEIKKSLLELREKGLYQSVFETASLISEILEKEGASEERIWQAKTGP